MGFNSQRLGNTFSTLRVKVNAVNYYFALYHLPPPGIASGVRMVLRGIQQLSKGRSGSKRPISVDLLRSIHQFLFSRTNSTTWVKHTVIWGVIALSYFFLLRTSEITLTTKNNKLPFILTRNQVFVRDRHGRATRSFKKARSIGIFLSGAKNDPDSIGSMRVLEKSGDPIICPVKAVLELKRVTKQIPQGEPLCMFSKHEGITRREVDRVIKKTVACKGGRPSNYSTHSLRSGGATTMYKAGVEPMTIQQLGRWKSDTYKLYTRLSSEQLGKVTRAMLAAEEKDTTMASKATIDDKLYKQLFEGSPATPRPF